MFTVRNGEIYHIRGDTGTLVFQPSFETGADVRDYTAILSVKKDIKDSDYVMQKTCKNGQFDFVAGDTDGLEAGDYIYDIEVHVGKTVQTIGPYKYHLFADVTRGVIANG
ncbi:hypothetical protein [Mitsuokella sp.]|uniref:hypothetical protein n=1 Tax=Mitsuokella sp. TaxID=2049034 RepID=UPI003D7CF313